MTAAALGILLGALAACCALWPVLRAAREERDAWHDNWRDAFAAVRAGQPATVAGDGAWGLREALTSADWTVAL